MKIEDMDMARQRILIVEDSLTVRQLLVFALQRIRDLEIVEAQDGMDGLRQIVSDHFDLVFIDINMPRMGGVDGLTLISLIRGVEDLTSMPICVITTEAAHDERMRALALGANESLTIPIQANRVLAVAKRQMKLDV